MNDVKETTYAYMELWNVKEQKWGISKEERENMEDKCTSKGIRQVEIITYDGMRDMERGNNICTTLEREGIEINRYDQKINGG